MEKQERSAIDMLLDENCSDNIFMYDENDKEVEFEQVAVIPFEEKVYAILHPLIEDSEFADDEAVVFVLEEIDDEDSLVLVEDEALIDKIYVIYYKLLKENGKI